MLVLWLLYAAAVVYSCLLPAADIPFEELPNDKILHFLSYLPFGVLPFRTFRTVRASLLAAGVGPVIGVLVEFAQSMSPGRTPEVADAVANTLGVLCGVAIGFVIRAKE
jgi:VanZ family protein